MMKRRSAKRQHTRHIQLVEHRSPKPSVGRGRDFLGLSEVVREMVAGTLDEDKHPYFTKSPVSGVWQHDGNKTKVNYPPTAKPTAKPMGWASDFTDLRFFTEVLFESPSVFSSVPPEIIFNPSFRMFFAAFSSLSK